MEIESVFSSQRKRLVREYAKAGQEVIIHTIPYHSTAVLEFEVVDRDSDPAPGIAWAVARRNQRLSFFSYGIGEQVNLGGSAMQVATEAETNLAKGSSTNGAQDFVIEGVGFHCRGVRARYGGGSGDAIRNVVNDADVRAATFGDVALYDPAAIILAPQVQSPFNLENGLFQSLLGQASVEFLFDRKRVEKIGTLDLLPQAGAQSYLRANGSPESSNRYRIPEGYLWRKDGLPDSELEVNVTLQRPLVVPINLVEFNQGASPALVSPDKIYLEVVMRLYGLAVDMPSAN